jgi:hypothetical protein
MIRCPPRLRAFTWSAVWPVSVGLCGCAVPSRSARRAGDAYAEWVPARARVEDIHELALQMPHTTVIHGRLGNPIYQVGGKSFIFFRTPRPDAVDSRTGKRYPDVIVFWVASEADKLALLQDPATPFFTTRHFDGHPSVLVRAAHVGEFSRSELTEHVQDAWLARASARRRSTWLSAHGLL